MNYVKVSCRIMFKALIKDGCKCEIREGKFSIYTYLSCIYKPDNVPGYKYTAEARTVHATLRALFNSGTFITMVDDETDNLRTFHRDCILSITRIYGIIGDSVYTEVFPVVERSGN
jgi:hypothetical protein